MFITTLFNDGFGPVTGLTPLIKIRLVDDGGVVVSGTMSEVGDGFYTYDFVNYDITKNYAILCDALILPDFYRYKFLSSGEYGSIINNIDLLSEEVNTLSTLVKKILINRLELIDGDFENWVLYDDDDATVLLKWDVADKFGGEIIQRVSDVSSRTRGV